MNRTLTRGHISELAFTKACLELGFEVLQPVGTERYDLVVVVGGRFLRVQVKTGCLRNGSLEFNTCSNAAGVGRPVSYSGHVDAIGVYSPDLDSCFWVPWNQCAKSHARLRVDPARNGAKRGIRWASQFRLEALATPGQPSV